MAREKKEDAATEKLWAKVPRRVREQVEELAASEDRTMSYLVRRFVEDGLKRYPKSRAA